MRAFPSSIPGEIGFFLLRRSEIAKHQNLREIADDGAFVLQIVVQAEPLRRQMLADDRHGEIADILAAEFLRQREAQKPRLVGAAAHFAAEALPIPCRGSPPCSKSVRAHSRR